MAPAGVPRVGAAEFAIAKALTVSGAQCEKLPLAS